MEYCTCGETYSELLVKTWVQIMTSSTYGLSIHMYVGLLEGMIDLWSVFTQSCRAERSQLTAGRQMVSRQRGRFQTTSPRQLHRSYLTQRDVISTTTTEFSSNV